MSTSALLRPPCSTATAIVHPGLHGATEPLSWKIVTQILDMTKMRGKGKALFVKSKLYVYVYIYTYIYKEKKLIHMVGGKANHLKPIERYWAKCGYKPFDMLLRGVKLRMNSWNQ